MAINNIITLAGIISYGVSWTAIYLLQQSDLIGRVTNVDSWIGGAMGAVLIGGLFKWMLKRHDTLARRVDDLHDQLLEQHREHETKMLEMQRNHFDELMRRIEEAGLYRNRCIEIEAYCRRNPCNLPDRLFAPVTIEDTQSTEALLLASEQITQDAPYGTRDDKEK